MLRFTAIALLASAAAVAQTPANPGYHADRQTVLYQGGKLLAEQSGWSWQQGDILRAYAAAHSSLHGGNFVLFRDENGAVRDLNDQAAVEHLQNTWAPMIGLSAQQHALGEPQKSLGEVQHALGQQMHATSSPAEMGRIGQQMGAVGSAQGQIGREQGAVGREQGRIGRAFYAELSDDISHCLSANSCPIVAQLPPALAR